MKKLLAIFSFTFFTLLGVSHGANPVRYVQISTNALTQQTGAFNVAAGTSTNFNATASTITRLNVITAADMGGNKITSVSSGTVASDATRYSQTKYLNINQFTTTTATQTTSTSFRNSNLTITTPTPQSSASRFKLSFSGTGTNSAAATAACEYDFGRNSANLNGTHGIQDFDGAAASADFPVGMTYIDSPGSAVAVTYTVMFRASGGVTCSLNVGNQTGVLIVEEINGL